MPTSQTYACQILDWGLIHYREAYELQKKLVEEVRQGASQKIVFCEHPTVLTLGRMTKEENLLWSKEEFQKQGVDIYPIDRGGDVTLHSPGQLIVYPLFNLENYGKDLKSYLWRLEEISMDVLKEFGILAQRNPGKTGVWAGSKKIVSLGIGVKKWVAFHGVGINVNTDLSLFSMIRPCGLNVSMTSMAQQTGSVVNMGLVKDKLKALFEKNFNLFYC
jgi:lipoate-protein ligase B